MTDDQKQLAIKTIAKGLVVAGMLVDSGNARVLVSITRDFGLAERAASLVFEHMVEMARWGVATPRIVRLLLDQIAALANES